MPATVSIDKVEIKIGDKEVSLTLEQLKELKGLLDGLFPQPIVIDRPYPVVVPQPYPVPYVPPYNPWPWPLKYQHWNVETPQIFYSSNTNELPQNRCDTLLLSLNN